MGKSTINGHLFSIISKLLVYQRVWGFPGIGVPQYMDGFCLGQFHLEMDDEKGG